MVFFFETVEGYTIYMGVDKFENEELIKYGLPEDMWFHVDDMSSAHVYLRLKKNEKIEDISPDIIHQCGQLVKANSIEGCKLREVTVIYTRWRNLHKTSDMQVGAIGFHDRNKVKRIKIEKDNTIINRLNKTKQEKFPNLQQLQIERASEYQREQKEIKKQEIQRLKEQKVKLQEEQRLRSYVDVMIEDNMTSNKEMNSSIDTTAAKQFEEDFM